MVALFYSLFMHIQVLGCGSAVPAPGRGPSAQWVSSNERHYLLDCGEGTQMQIRRYRLPMQRLSAIFISHMHADHFLGLPGLLGSMDMLDRRKPLVIAAPTELFTFLDFYTNSTGHKVRYPIERVVLSNGEGKHCIYTDKSITVHSIGLRHTVPCKGFILTEATKNRKFDKEKVQQLNLQPFHWQQLLSGKTIQLENGSIIDPESVLLPADKSLRYAYFTDTRPRPDLAPEIMGVNLLYHEATFMEEHASRARKTRHSTAKEAAEMAQACAANSLLIGHYSNRYTDLTGLLNEAAAIFPRVFLAEEGGVWDLANL